MIKVVVAGSREFNDYNKLELELLKYFKERQLHRGDIEIVSGTARGTDRLGEQFAHKYNIKLTKFPADWDKYGKSAGYRRNEQMAKYSDVLIAFWNGTSKGTGHMIMLAKANNVEVNIVNV